jgi:CheY-like chemotaxis protein
MQQQGSGHSQQNCSSSQIGHGSQREVYRFPEVQQFNRANLKVASSLKNSPPQHASPPQIPLLGIADSPVCEESPVSDEYDEPANIFDQQLSKLVGLLGEAHNQRIYVIDDFLYNIKAAQMMLEAAGFRTEGETSAIKALDHLRAMQGTERHYDIVLVDMNMPEMDGLICTSKIRSMINSGEIQPIVIVQCTAYSSENDRLASMRAGADGFTNKPLTYDGLYRAIKHKY